MFKISLLRRNRHLLQAPNLKLFGQLRFFPVRAFTASLISFCQFPFRRRPPRCKARRDWLRRGIARYKTERLPREDHVAEELATGSCWWCWGACSSRDNFTRDCSIPLPQRRDRFPPSAPGFPLAFPAYPYFFQYLLNWMS